MSRSIDEKIVEMRFDNRQFESNVQTSLSTLGKLKESLKLKDAAKGFQEVDAASKRVNFNPIGDGIEAVKVKFSALEVMAVTALANITNSALNAGKRLVSAFTIDPIKTGFQEYETQINAVQTILANTQSKGTNIEQVNKALDELNHYADKTIYNFTEMTRNIGTFTAAGVDLNTSVNAIQGIANLAATSGSTSQQASTAMYQLSQALAAGTVKLQDWNSVVNAGMGGQVFQEALKETARAHGIAIDKMIKDEGSFRESLQNGWITSDILTETLQHFTEFTEDYNEETLKAQGYTDEQIAKIKQLGITGTEAATKVKTFTQLMDTLKEAAQSGWTQSWEYIIGDFEEAKALWTEVSDYFNDAINKSSDARNKVLWGWKYLGGREVLINGLKNAFQGLMNVINPIKEAFREIFPPKKASELFELTKAFENLTSKFKEFTGKHSADIKNAFLGIFSVIDIGFTFIKELGNGIVRIIGNFTGFTGGILEMVGSIGQWLTSLRDSVKGTDIFGKAIDKVVEFIQKGIDKFKEFKEFISSKISFPKFDGISISLGKICGLFGKACSAVKNFGSAAVKAFSSAFQNGSIKNLIGIFNGGVFASILLNIRKLTSSEGLDGVKDIIEKLRHPLDSLKDMLSPVESVLDGVKGCLKAYQEQLKAGILIKIAAAIGILAASIWVLSTIDAKSLTSAVIAMSILFDVLVGAIGKLAKIEGFGKDTRRMAIVMIEMSAALLIAATAIKIISGLSPEQMLTSVIAIGVMLAMLIKSAEMMCQQEGTMTKFAGQMILLSIALGLLSGVAKILSTFSLEELVKAGAGILGMIGMLVAAAKIMDTEDSAITKFAGQMIGISIAVGALTIVAKVLSGFSWEELIKAGSGLFGMIGMLVAAAKIMNSDDSAITKFAGQMLIMSVAVGALTIVAKVLSGFSWEELVKAGAGLFGMIGMLVAAAKIMDGEDAAITKFAGQMLIMSVAVGILTKVAKTLSEFSWEELIKAGAGLFGMIGMLVAAAVLLSNFGGQAIAGAGAMIIMAAAIAILAPALKTLGEMSVWEIVKGLIALAGAFAIIGIAGVILGTIAPLLIVAGAAVALFGVAALACGVGVLALSTGLSALAVSGAAGVGALCFVILELVKLIPSIAVAVGEGLIEIVKVIGESAGTIAEVVVTLIDRILKVIAEHLPSIVESGYQILLALMDGLANHIDEIVTKATDIVVNFINALSENHDRIRQAGWDFVINLIDGIANSITENEPRLKESLINLGTAMWNAFCDFWGIHSPSTVMYDAGGFIIEGLLNGISALVGQPVEKIKELGSNMLDNVSEKMEPFRQKGSELIDSMKNGIGNKFGVVKSETTRVVTGSISAISAKMSSFRTKGGELMTRLKTGISEKLKSVKNATKEVVKGSVDAINEKVHEFFEAGKNIMEGFINGIKEKAQGIRDAVVSGIGDAMGAVKEMLGIHSPSKVFEQFGRYTDEGYIIGVEKYSDRITKATEGIGKSAIYGMSNALKNVKDMSNEGLNVSPRISPVMDMSTIGATNISFGATVDTMLVKPISTISRIISDAQSEINASNMEVISAINGLRDDLSNLYDEDDKEIALYVDSKKLASSIVKPMNKQLNILSKRGSY